VQATRAIKLLCVGVLLVGSASAYEASSIANSSAATPEPQTFSNQTSITTTYAASNKDIVNPERGFHGYGNLTTSAEIGAATADYSSVRAAGMTLIRGVVRLDSYRERAIPNETLAELDASFDKVRPAGIKVNPYFYYNFPTAPGVSKIPSRTSTPHSTWC